MGFVLAASLFAYLYGSLSTAEFLDWGWRYPFVAFAINVVARLPGCAWWWSQSYAELLQQRGSFKPVSVSQVVR